MHAAVDSSYAISFKRDEAKDTAKRLADLISNALKECLEAGYVIDAVVTTGKSGLAAGYAALMFTDFPLVYVRKQNEQSHGTPIEGPSIDVSTYLFLDDLISSGDTFYRVKHTLPNAVCLGAILYNTCASEKFLKKEYNLAFAWTGAFV